MRGFESHHAPQASIVQRLELLSCKQRMWVRFLLEAPISPGTLTLCRTLSAVAHAITSTTGMKSTVLLLRWMSDTVGAGVSSINNYWCLQCRKYFEHEAWLHLAVFHNSHAIRDIIRPEDQCPSDEGTMKYECRVKGGCCAEL
jgi:hypothetical protein